MWVLWKMRLCKCDFCQKWGFENVNFVKNYHFEIVEFLDKFRIFAQVCAKWGIVYFFSTLCKIFEIKLFKHKCQPIGLENASLGPWKLKRQHWWEALSCGHEWIWCKSLRTRRTRQWKRVRWPSRRMWGGRISPGWRGPRIWPYSRFQSRDR